VGRSVGHLVERDQTEPRRGGTGTRARAGERVAGLVVAGVELGVGDAAVLRDLLCRLGHLRTDEQSAGRNAFGDERPVVGGRGQGAQGGGDGLGDILGGLLGGGSGGGGGLGDILGGIVAGGGGGGLGDVLGGLLGGGKR
jgi:hypothetical protein